MSEARLWVEKKRFFHPDSDKEDWTYQVMQEHPSIEGQPYSIANYGDEAAAEEHARTGRKPKGYG